MKVVATCVLILISLIGGTAHASTHPNVSIVYSDRGLFPPRVTFHETTLAPSHRQRVHRRQVLRVHSHPAVPSYSSSGREHSRPEGLVTVPTAAGLSITVAASDKDQFLGFIKDLVATGYHPKSIGCYASSGHVHNSNHYHGGACDFDQTARNRTALQMYNVSSIAHKWGLRDGCSFRSPDCGHIDDGRNIGWVPDTNIFGRYVKYQTEVVAPSIPKLVPFDE